MTVELAEQVQDWTEPGAHPVLPGVHRIPLPLPLDGLRAVNVYVLDGPDGPTLVDSGWVDADGDALEVGLRALGYAPADVAQVVVTHAHHDHYTQALALRSAHGTRVVLGRGEEPSVAAQSDRAAHPAPQSAMVAAAGAADLARDLARHVAEVERVDLAPWSMPDAWLDDGDLVAAGEGELEVRATPGHTRGHVVLRDTARGALFSGDHVLPHITPSIGYERAPEPMPLRSYLDSLRLVRDLPDSLLLPAHGPVTRSVHTRVDELLAHHEQRLAAAAARVGAGDTTAWAVASALPWTRRERHLSQLETEHAALAVLEIAAHLDVLVDAGVLVAHDGEDGLRRYAPS
ncbi:MBL fold metallo-hydrolase [Pseudonocardia sp. ICBG1142]|uniref:MBL fold metallo-hydrolase n=1 Tax=Pseudonocardia sp. ICBG1142 TaxID=2846760 RepID=UPI001CF6C933|nr:MBL fold metallo-hydrolase [Pseudonocardia sp. ICBG1142]